MKKLSKKLMCSVLACSLMTAFFVGCASSGKTVKSTDNAVSPSAAQETTKAGGYTVSGNIWGQGVNALDIIAAEAQYVNESVGNTFKVYNDNFTADTQASNIQNMASSGTNGIMIFGSVPTLYNSFSSTCNQAKIPFVFFDQIPTDKDVISNLNKNTYYVGSVGTDNTSAGQNVAKKMLSNGIKSALVLGGAVGDPVHDARVKGFTEAFKQGGGKVLATGRCDSPSDAATKSDDLISANPDAEAFYALTGDFAIGAITALTNHNKKTPVYCSDTTKECIPYIENGTIAYGDGGSKIVTTLAALLLDNYLNGNIIKDSSGTAPYFGTNVPFEITAQNAGQYSTAFLQGHPMSVDALKKFTGKDVAYQTFTDFIKNYSMDEVTAK